jgi:hypothetical protein
MDNCTAITHMTCELNWSQTFFILLSFIPVATLLPTWVVARFIWLPYMEKTKRESDAFLAEEIPYEKRHSLEDAEHSNPDIPGLIKSYIMETTPDGALIMRYNKKNEGFEYWADTAIKYKYLESAARKYVTTHHCKDLYIDRIALLKKKINKFRKEIRENLNKKTTKVDKPVEDSVFMKSKTSLKGNLKTKLIRDDFVCEESNKFMHRGKIQEAVFSKKEKEIHAKRFTFADWKNALNLR